MTLALNSNTVTLLKIFNYFNAGTWQFIFKVLYLYSIYKKQFTKERKIFHEKIH